MQCMMQRYMKYCLKCIVLVLRMLVVVCGAWLDRGLGQPKGMSWLLGHMGPVDSRYLT